MESLKTIGATLLFSFVFVHFPFYAVGQVLEASISVDTIVVSGHVRPEAEVEIMSRAVGQIKSIHVGVGDAVKIGQALAQLETKELEIQVRQSKADLQSAQATLAKVRATAEAEARARYASARANLKRLEMALIQAEIDAKLKTVQTETAIKRSEAHLRSFQARLKLAKAGARAQQIEQARAQLEDAKRNYERKVALQKETFASEEEVDHTRLQYDLARAQLELLLEGSRPEDIEIAASDVESAQATLAYDRAKGLRLDEVVQSSLEAAGAQVKQATAKLLAAEIAKDMALWKEDLSLVEANFTRAQAVLALSEKRLADASLRSPIDGIIAAREFDQGDTITPTSVLFSVVNMQRVDIRANIFEQDIPAVRKSSQARVISSLYPNKVFEGTVINVSPIMDSKSQTAEIIVRVDNHKLKLKPGMLVRIEVPRSP